jgi:hypothetical protein
MGIVGHLLPSSPSLSLSRLGAPGWSMLLAPVQANHRSALHSSVCHQPHAQIIVKRVPALAVAAASTCPVRRLKIMREFEPGMGRSQSGRMAISGRMSDVCAELDRIAQHDTPRL